MVKEKLDLSKKIHCMKHNYKTCKWTYPEQDVKRFIKKIKQKLKIRFHMKDKYIKELMDESAGKNLVEG